MTAFFITVGSLDAGEEIVVADMFGLLEIQSAQI
jgi:predicted PolB exonuclease-like 3'-5' exonuclease